MVNIIATSTLNKYKKLYPSAAIQLTEWYNEFRKQTFLNFNELKAVYANASLVGNSRVVFNIKRNDFRLVVMMNFKAKSCYILWFGTHSEYDKVDVKTVNFRR